MVPRVESIRVDYKGRMEAHQQGLPIWRAFGKEIGDLSACVPMLRRYRV